MEFDHWQLARAMILKDVKLSHITLDFLNNVNIIHYFNIFIIVYEIEKNCQTTVEFVILIA